MTEAELIADLKATFPGIYARPVREYGQPEYQEGVWVAGEACMPDGLPIFRMSCSADPDHYNGYAHHAFEAWLETRGYLLECWDVDTHFAIPVNGSLFG